MNLSSRFIAVFALSTLWISPPFETPARAQPPVNLAEAWQEQLQETRAMLESGRWRKARRESHRLLEEMTESIQEGDSAHRFLATAALHRSLAQAGLGQLEEARWDWHMALALRPGTANVDLSPFGAAGKALLQARNDFQATVNDTPPEVTQDDMTPPKAVRRPVPDYPWATRAACVQGPTVILAVIEKNGRLSSPEIVEAPNPVQAFSAMEALRDWRYEPATYEGKAIRSALQLQVNFRIPGCPGDSPAASTSS